VQALGGLRQFVRRTPRGLDVACREHDLDIAGQQPRSSLGAARLVDREAEAGRGRFRLALGQS